MRDLPPPLPPAERTVGQVIGETIRAYGDHFWRLVPLGIPLAVVDQASVHHRLLGQMAIFAVAAPFVTAAFVYACAVVYRVRPTAAAFLVGLAIYAPFPVLRAAYALPGVAWFAFVGLAVPAALVEGLRFRAAVARGRELGRADYAHALGSLAALTLVVGIAEYALQVLLHSQSDNSLRAALLLSDLVLSPLLYIGGAMLYQDQAARVGSPRPRTRSARHADVHPSLDADPSGGADAESQS
jgi:hypothetical protein